MALIGGVAILLLAGCAREDVGALRSAACKGVFPTTLVSAEAAKIYTGALFAGGRVDQVRVGLRGYLVIFHHGSGIPVIRIAVYRRSWWDWKLVAEPRPPVPEFMHAVAADGRIIVVEEQSGRKWPLYEP